MRNPTLVGVQITVSEYFCVIMWNYKLQIEFDLLHTAEELISTEHIHHQFEYASLKTNTGSGFMTAKRICHGNCLND